MSAPRMCAKGHLVGGFHTPPTSPDWVCPAHSQARRDRGWSVVEKYARLLNYDDPEDQSEHEQAAIDLIADVLHYLTELDSSVADDPERVTSRAGAHYLIEHAAQWEERA